MNVLDIETGASDSEPGYPLSEALARLLDTEYPHGFEEVEEVIDEGKEFDDADPGEDDSQDGSYGSEGDPEAGAALAPKLDRDEHGERLPHRSEPALHPRGIEAREVFVEDRAG